MYYLIILLWKICLIELNILRQLFVCGCTYVYACVCMHVCVYACVCVCMLILFILIFFACPVTQTPTDFLLFPNYFDFFLFFFSKLITGVICISIDSRLFTRLFVTYQ